MKIAILGWAAQGISAYNYWNKPENAITICDMQTPVDDVPSGVETCFGEVYLQDLDRFDLIIRTPSLHPRDIIAANSLALLKKVTTNTNEFMRVCPTKNVVGVTGTKGKGTTSTLVSKMLEAAGNKVHLGGNIGTPPLDLLAGNIQPTDWVVLELANFQLIDIKYSPRIAVCLMIVPEHLNWHADLQEYIDAKRKLVIYQSASDLLVYNADNPNSTDIAGSSPARKLWYKAPADAMDTSNATVADGKVYMGSTEICSVSDIALLGQHNWQNVSAAVAAVWEATGHNRDAVRSVITTFKGLPHRLELVRELDGVKYYNDSFGTTPETAQVAIEAFEQPKVVILGGSSKGSNYEELAQTIARNNIRQIILIGNTTNTDHPTAAPEIQSALRAQGIDRLTVLTKPGGATMTEIVQTAQSAAQPGDVVLLSAACASFDIFANYKDRGEQFSTAVRQLAS